MDQIRSGKYSFICGKNEDLFVEILDSIGLEKNINYTRQFVFEDHFVVDFCFESIKLFVEIDGKGHNSKEKREEDRERDFLARSKGWSIIRIKEDKMIENPTFYKMLIKEMIKQ